MSEITTVNSSKDVANYDPDKGLKAIAVAEAAEKYYARAKDSTALEAAIVAKLTGQRDFVIWWDGQEKDKGGGDVRNTDNRPVIGVKAEKFGLDLMTVSRWRSRLKSETKFAEQLEKAHERCIKVCETPSVLYPRAVNSGNNEWYTPEKYIKAARDVMGAIDLDPASSDVAQETVQAAEHFTPADDGLALPWHGRVWLNPPYAQPLITHFVEKLTKEWGSGHLTAAILLTHNYTDTKWFHLAANSCSAICFTRGRITFPDANGNACSPTQGQAFFYFGKNPAAFADRFSSIGVVLGRMP